MPKKGIKAETEVYMRVFRADRKKPKFVPKFIWDAGQKIGLIKKGKWTKKKRIK